MMPDLFSFVALGGLMSIWVRKLTRSLPTVYKGRKVHTDEK